MTIKKLNLDVSNFFEFLKILIGCFLILKTVDIAFHIAFPLYIKNFFTLFAWAYSSQSKEKVIYFISYPLSCLLIVIYLGIKNISSAKLKSSLYSQLNFRIRQNLPVNFFPYFYNAFNYFRLKKISKDKQKYFLWGALLFIIVQISYVFLPLIDKPFRIKNEFINISETTILRNGVLANNLQFINDHNFLGLTIHNPNDSNSNNLGEAKNHNLLSDIINYEKTYSNQELDFYYKNKDEIQTQLKVGWFFFHHNYNYGSMIKIESGIANPESIYGWLSTITQNKILTIFNANNFHSYLKLFFSLYLFYFLLLLSFVWLVFKDIKVVILCSLLYASSINFLGLDLLKLAPGFNPVRHFFDIPAIFFAFMYFKNSKFIYKYLSLIIGFFSILWSKEFGFFLLTSIIFSFLLDEIYRNKKLIPNISTISSNLLFFFVGLVFFYFASLKSVSLNSKYFFMGVGSIPIGPLKYSIVMLMIYSVWKISFMIDVNQKIRPLILLTSAYLTLSSFYLIWNPTPIHLLGVTPIYIFWAILIFKYSKCNEKLKNKAFLFLFFFIYFPSAFHMYNSIRSEDRIFETHTVYNWDFDHAKFQTTTNPELFKEAVTMIGKYESKSTFYLISKYENLIPIISNKANTLPFVELMSNLVSKEEIIMVTDKIKNDKPNIIFIDTDIEKEIGFNEVPNISDRIVSSSDFNYVAEAIAKKQTYDNLRKVYKGISSDYKVCNIGRLISVYCLKP